MYEQILAYLRSKGSAASSVELAENVLKLRSPRAEIADQLIRSIIAESRAIYRTGSGQWRLDIEKGDDESSLFLLRFFPERVSDWTQWRAGLFVRMSWHGVQESCWLFGPEDFSVENLTTAMERAIASFGDGPLLFDGFGNQISMFRRAAVLTVGLMPENPIITLKSLVERILPEVKVRTHAQLSLALGAVPLEDASPEAIKQNLLEQCDVLLHQLRERGVSTTEELLDFVRPKVYDFDFSQTAFEREFIETLPHGPGCYVMRDLNGTVIYVGKSKNLRQRLQSYFALTADMDDKLQRIRQQLYDLEIIPAGSELEALLLEQELIEKYDPPINQQIDVHFRVHIHRPRYSRILILPASDRNCVKLFLLQPDAGLKVLEMKKARPARQKLKREIQKHFFRPVQNPDREVDRRLEIASSWLALNEDRINSIDMRKVATIDEAIRLVLDYIQSMNECYDRVVHY